LARNVKLIGAAADSIEQIFRQGSEMVLVEGRRFGKDASFASLQSMAFEHPSKGYVDAFVMFAAL
jgi:hypothetical protein